MQNDYYSKRYYDLYVLLEQAYMDKGVLEGIEEYYNWSEKRKEHLSFWERSIVEHICEIAKQDLISIVAKISEKSTNGNTIDSLKRFLEANGKSFNDDFNSLLENANNAVKAVRDTYISHNDKKHKGLPIKLSCVYLCLETCRSCFNKLYFVELDSNLSDFNQSKAYSVSGKAKIGIITLLKASSVSSNHITPKKKCPFQFNKKRNCPIRSKNKR